MKDNNLRGIFPALFGPNGAKLFSEIFKWMNDSMGVGTAVLNLERYGIAGDCRRNLIEYDIVERIIGDYRNGTMLVGQTNEEKTVYLRNGTTKTVNIHRYYAVYLTKYGYNGRGSTLDENDLDKKSHWFFALFKEFDSQEENSILVPPLGRCAYSVRTGDTKGELNYYINKDLTPTKDELECRISQDFTANDTLIIIKSGSKYHLYRVYKKKKELFKILDSLDIEYDRVKN
jgi:hypothetical protein